MSAITISCSVQSRVYVQSRELLTLAKRTFVQKELPKGTRITKKNYLLKEKLTQYSVLYTLK